MEEYKMVLLNSIYMITISYSLLILLLGVVCLFFYIKKRKKFLSNAMYIVLLFVMCIASYSYLVIPRVVDLKNNNYVVVEDVSLGKVKDIINGRPGKHLLYFGDGTYIRVHDGSTIYLTGTEFFDFSFLNTKKEINCTLVVYAETSKQLIDIQFEEQREKTSQSGDG